MGVSNGAVPGAIAISVTVTVTVNYQASVGGPGDDDDGGESDSPVDIGVVAGQIAGHQAAFVYGGTVISCNRRVVDGIDGDADGGSGVEAAIADGVVEGVVGGLGSVMAVAEGAVGVQRQESVGGRIEHRR